MGKTLSGMGDEAVTEPVMKFVRQDRQGEVLVVFMDRPPVNALDSAQIAGLRAAFAAARAEEGLVAVVLASGLPQFCVGLDISELTRVKGQGLPELCAEIEAMPLPVVAALQGNALGAGLELALACHARLATPKVRLGLPEIALGLLPGGGATQRLPRLAGAAPALHLLLDGAIITAGEALAIGLLDRVEEEALLPAALAHARSLAGTAPRRSGERRDGMRDGMGYQAAVAAAREKVAGSRLPAPERIIDCVEAAQLLPFDQGLGYERAAFEEIAATPEAAGLRHAFLADRRALFPPAAVTALTPPALGLIGIRGTGGAAAEVARMALSAGLRVVLTEPDRATLAATLQRIAAKQEALVAEGKLSPAARDADWGRLQSRQDEAGLAEADLILTTAGSFASIKPQAALGGEGPLVLHPASQSGGLAEIAVAEGVPPAAQALVLAFARRLGWRTMFAAPGGPVERRLRAALSRAVAWLDQSGVSRADIAAALAAFGLGAAAKRHLPAAPARAADVVPACLAALANEGARMIGLGVVRRPAQVDAAAVLSGLFPRWEGGPMFLADRRGLMALRADLRRRAETAPELFAPAPLIDRLISEGRDFAALNG